MPNSVDTEPREYTEAKRLWTKCREIAEGQEVVHKKGKKYLPRLSGQNDDQYDNYKDRTLFYNATARTIQGLSGMIMRKKATIDYENDQQLEEFLKDVTASGMDFNSYGEEMVGEILTVGRAGVLTEYPRVNTSQLTVAEAERLGLRPYWERFEAENITIVRTGMVNNKPTVTMIVLKFVEEQQNPDDEFVTDLVERYKVLDLTEAPGAENLIYRQRIFKKVIGNDAKETTKWEQDGDDILPRIDGEFLDEIPFVFFGVRNTGSEIDKPPLLDLVNANVNHYQKSADLTNALHVAGLPTPTITGHQTEEGETVKLGTTTCLVIKDANGKAFFMELEGKSLEALSKDIQAVEEKMAFLGARMLAPEKRQAEAAETAAIHRQGEVSVLGSIANGLSAGFLKCLEHVTRFYGIDIELQVEFNTDFLPYPMNAQSIKAHVEAWQQGAFGWSDLIHSLKRGEIIREDRTAEDVKSEIETERPPGLNGGGVFN